MLSISGFPVCFDDLILFTGGNRKTITFRWSNCTSDCVYLFRWQTGKEIYVVRCCRGKNDILSGFVTAIHVTSKYIPIKYTHKIFRGIYRPKTNMTFFEERGMNKVQRVLDVTDVTGCDNRFPVMACLNVILLIFF